MSPSNEPRKSKAERTAEAREKARLIREAQVKKEKRNKVLLIWGVVVAAVVIVAIVVWSVMTSIANNAPIADQGPAPANSTSQGGTVLTKDGVQKSAAGTVDVASLPAPVTPSADGKASPSGVAPEAGKPVKVVAFIDFICPACNAFEQRYSGDLDKAVNDGTITLEYRPIGMLDRNSSTNYSSRAAAAAACVLNTSPDKYAAYVKELFAQQPPEGGAGLSNDQLKQIAKDTGADISSCVDEKTYRPFVKVATQRALNEGVAATPTVFVDGKQFGVDTPKDKDFPVILQEAIAAKAKAKG